MQREKHLLIIFHTQSGNTERLARAVLAGAKEETACETRCLCARDATLQDLLWCDAIIFGTPENFGYMSGALKDFFDRTYYPAEPYALNRPYAIFISAGNDGTGAVREINRIAKGYPLVPVAEPLICVGELNPSHLNAAHDLGLTIAAGLVFGIY